MTAANKLHMSNETSFSSRVTGKAVYLLGTPDTSRRGRNTLNARSAFTSKPFWSSDDKIVLIRLQKDKTAGVSFTCSEFS